MPRCVCVATHAFALQVLQLRRKPAAANLALRCQSWRYTAIALPGSAYGLQRRCVVICALTCASMLTGFRTLPLLCKTTQMLPADVVQLVQECLRLHVGKRCPAWIDSLFVQQLRGFGMESEVIFTVCAVQHINLARG